MAARRGGWGGPRKGAGRKPGSGSDPATVRRNRLTITLTDAELAALQAWAEERDLPTGTVAYEVVARALARRRRR